MYNISAVGMTFTETKKTMKLVAGWWSANEKWFCCLFKSSPALLERYAEFNRLL